MYKRQTLGGSVWLFADDFHQIVNTIQDAIVASDTEEHITAIKPIPLKPVNETLVVGEASSATSPRIVITPVDWQPAKQTRGRPDPANVTTGRFLPVELTDFNQPVMR